MITNNNDQEKLEGKRLPVEKNDEKCDNLPPEEFRAGQDLPPAIKGEARELNRSILEESKATRQVEEESQKEFMKSVKESEEGVNLTIPPNCLHPVLEGVADAMVEVMNVDKKMVVNLALSAAFSTVQTYFNVESFFGSIPLNTFHFTLSPSGCKKSAVQNLLQLHIMDFQNNHRKICKAQIEQKQLTSEETPPPYPYMLIREWTIEALLKQASDGYPTFTVTESEAFGFFDGPSGKGDRTRRLKGLNLFYDSQSIDKSLVSKGYSSAENYRISLNVAGQTEACLEFFQDPKVKATGFWARCFITESKSPKIREVLREDIRRREEFVLFQRCMRNIHRLPIPYLDGNLTELNPFNIPMDTAAEEMVVKFDYECQKFSSQGQIYEGIREFMLRGAVHAMKLAALNAIMREAAKGVDCNRPPDIHAISVNVDDVRGGCHMVRMYAEEHRNVMELSRRSRDAVAQDKVASFISRNSHKFRKRPFTSNTIIQSAVLKTYCDEIRLRGKEKGNEIERLLQELVNIGFLRVEREGTRNRRTSFLLALNTKD